MTVVEARRVVLGLDLGTISGWAFVGDVGDRSTPLWWGLIDAKPRTKDEPEGTRFLRFHTGLVPVLDRYRIDAVAIEQTFSAGFRAAQILYGMVAVTMLELERREIPYQFVPSQTWHSYIGGETLRGLRTKVVRESKTKAEIKGLRKAGIREALNGWGGIEPGTTILEDEADALGVAKYLVETSLTVGVR